MQQQRWAPQQMDVQASKLQGIIKNWRTRKTVAGVRTDGLQYVSSLGSSLFMVVPVGR